MESKRLFHIHRRNQYSEVWQVDNEICFTPEQINNYFSQFLNARSSTLLTENSKALIHNVDDFIEKLVSFLKIIPQLPEDIKEQQQKDLIETTSFILHSANDALRYYVGYIRELIYEEQRLKINPHLPSRRNCIWLFSKENLDFWLGNLCKNGNYDVFEVETYGTHHLADARFINNLLWDINQFEDFATKYWTGTLNHFPGESQDEVLFIGNLRIISRIN
jgi:hypothetical protein